MAGRSQRFYSAGYTQPKYRLEAHGRTVFEHAVASFEAVFNQERLVFVALEEDKAEGFIREKCGKLSIPETHVEIVLLDQATGGQAETVAEALERVVCKPEEPLTIFNIDTIRPGYRHPPSEWLDKTDGYLEVFEGAGDGWSFVEPGHQAGTVKRVTEKERISNLCSTGLYYFRMVATYMSAYAHIAHKAPADLPAGERYVAPLYNYIIKDGGTVGYNLIDEKDVFFCGTPDEYLDFKSGPAPV